jgi:hypothetical protein
MKKVQLIFSRRHNPGSVLLRTWMWSPWSHCGIIDGDEVIEALMFKKVGKRTLAEFKGAASKWEIIDVPCPDPDAVLAAARKHIGREYDWLGLVAFILRIEMQRPFYDFCSKLIAAAFSEAEFPLFRVEAWRIMPRDLYIRTYG